VSLAVALTCGVGAAIAYAGATATEHSAAHTGTGEPDRSGLLSLISNPWWLFGFFLDFVGLGLQILALSAGTVVLVQPILVLSLPLSLPIRWALRGPRPTGRDYLACVAILLGLTGFFFLLGSPEQSSALHRRHALFATLIALAAGGLICWWAHHRRSVPLRAAIYGGVAGAWFGLVGVLMDASITTWRERGLDGFAHPSGFMPLVGVIVVGALSITLTQISFQVGTLGASFPANLAAAPVVAVILGAALLREHVPASPPYLLGYLGCLIAVVVGSIQLADPTSGGAGDEATSSEGPEAPRLAEPTTG
jgi:drug/metabolite transporter (DMT)-like permease